MQRPSEGSCGNTSEKDVLSAAGLSDHGALQGMAVTFAMTSLTCSEHRLSSMASLDVGKEKECFTDTFWIMASIPPSLGQDTTAY